MRLYNEDLKQIKRLMSEVDIHTLSQVCCNLIIGIKECAVNRDVFCTFAING